MRTQLRSSGSTRRRAALVLTLVVTLTATLAVAASGAGAAWAAPAPLAATVIPQHSTTGPTPPPGAGRASGRLAGGAAGEVVISGVPAYLWRDGCGPTAVGMVLGYYDAHGWDLLIPGDATRRRSAVDQVIASHGSASGRGTTRTTPSPSTTPAPTPPAARQELPRPERRPPQRLGRRLHAHLVERRRPLLRLELLEHDRPGLHRVRRLRRAAVCALGGRLLHGQHADVDARQG